MDFLDNSETRYQDEQRNTAHTRYSGKRVRVKPRPIRGKIRGIRPYSSRTFTEWMMRCVLVRPRMALGFLLKAWTRESLNLLESEL